MQSLHKFVCVLYILHIISRSLCILNGTNKHRNRSDYNRLATPLGGRASGRAGGRAGERAGGRAGGQEGGRATGVFIRCVIGTGGWPGDEEDGLQPDRRASVRGHPAVTVTHTQR